MRTRRLSWLFLLLALTPTIAYEAFQKASERTRLPRHRVLILSARAERETPWRETTGERWVDRTLHELQETGRFYRLLGDRLLDDRRR